jgi:IclR family acetate operon transcriptional repressor
LADEVSEDVYLAAQTDHSVVYLKRFDGPNSVNVSIKLNEPRPLHASSVGKLFSTFNKELRDAVLNNESLEKITKNTIVEHSRLLDEFESIRQSGISVSNEESVEGVAGLSAPIYGPQERIIAAVHISALSARMSVERINHIVPLLKEAGELISKELGGSRPRTQGNEQVITPSSSPGSHTDQEAQS